MDIVCEQCKSKFKIPDDKIPPGKTVSLSCPKCKNKIPVYSSPKKEEEPVKETPPKPIESEEEEFYEDDYDSSDKPFSFIEEEGKTALICEDDPEVRAKIKQAMDLLEYHVTEPASIRESLKQMRFHNYDLILINESFDSQTIENNGILLYLERLHMSIRRNIFVALLSSQYKTMDNIIAFNKSVNLVINVKDIDEVARILQRSIADNDMFYRIYKESMKKMGVI